MQWEYAYGDIEPNTWYELPLKSLGVYNVKNKAVAVALADMPGYSDSTLYTALDVLYAIDYNYTQAQVDMYMGKTRGFIPKQMGGAGINTSGAVADGLSYTEAISQLPLQDDFYMQIANGVDGKPIQPSMMQPDLRGEAHKFIRDSELELLASKVGLSSSTLANHLSYNKSKTATEVRSEEDTTEKSVKHKRSLANIAINEMLKDIASYYGFDDTVEISWGRAGANSSTENQELLTDYQAGVLPLREYLKKRWVDLSEEDVENWAQIIEKEQEKKSKQDTFGQFPFNEKDYFNEGDESVENESGNRQT
jgi:AraC-like DNA-binding protein